MKFGAGLAAAGAASAWFGPAGLAWAGWTAAAAGMLLLAYRAAAALRRRAALRTLEGLRSLPPAAFEERVAAWLARDGWRVERTGRPGDGGIDLVAKKGREVAAVQCKRFAGEAAVGAAAVRDLYGAATAAGATLAVLVTTGRVTAPAAAWAAGIQQGPKLVLVDAGGVAAAARGGRLIR
ncbi:restriction endonuclease [Tepidiforma sp.]|jgi:HJR/Mrr/RecB family endonuclease|uniref:restriction endonuclease n=1 Tax=Tepidiforma sp. TaxID=2682230 RepID=UPI00260F39DE|nr:restriction endonuclease [Tepidiforma sp.]MCX7618248.1 restriction endonuclease [Tepidiforma sp.]